MTRAPHLCVHGPFTTGHGNTFEAEYPPLTTGSGNTAARKGRSVDEGIEGERSHAAIQQEPKQPDSLGGGACEYEPDTGLEAASLEVRGCSSGERNDASFIEGAIEEPIAVEGDPLSLDKDLTPEIHTLSPADRDTGRIAKAGGDTISAHGGAL